MGRQLQALLGRAKQAKYGLTDATQLPRQQLAARQLMALLGIGAAGGAGVRGLMGLRNMTQSPAIDPSPSANLPHAIHVFGEPREEEPSTVPMRKFAGGFIPQLQQFGQAAGQKLQDFGQAAGDFIGNTVPDAIAPHLPKTHTTQPLLNEWGIPAGIAAVGGGAYGGYKLMDWLLNKERDMAGQGELRDAESEYQQALADQYRAAMMAKGAGDDLGIGELADTYAARVEEHGRDKLASMSVAEYFMPGLSIPYEAALGYDNWQALKGGANAAILGAGLGASKLTYDWAKGQNKQELLRKALKRRQAMRQQLSPAPILALPDEETPVAA